MYYTKSIGNFVELQCIAKFISAGYECALPYGGSARYDFIVDLKEKGLKKIQCKAAVQTKNSDGTMDEAIQIKLSSSAGTYTKDDVDYFMTYYNGCAYIIPIEETSGKTKTLRFSPPQKNINTYNKAEDYLFEKFFSINPELENSKKEYFEMMSKDSLSEEYFCKQCNKKITRYSKTGLCEECYHKSIRIAQRPSREELKEMIRVMSFTKIGEKFHITDNAIRKWCESEKLPKTKKEINSYSDEEWSKI